MQVDIGTDLKEKPKKLYVDKMVEALENGEDPVIIEQRIMQEAEQEEKENPFQPETPDERYAARREEEASLENQIRAKEDELGGSRAGLERGLLGAIQTIGGTSLRRSNVDSGAFDKGMQTAQELIADPMKAAEQRRAFLKERLGRTDVPYRTLQDELVMKDRERKERMERATEPTETTKRLEEGKADIAGAQLKQRRFDPKSGLSTEARQREITKLKRTAAQIGRSDPGTAKSLLDMANRMETNAGLSEAEVKLLEDMKFTPPEDQSLEWFKARTARENALRPRIGEDKAKMLSDKQVQSITDLDNAIEAASNIARDKGEIDTGPISAMQNRLAQMVGIDDPQKTTFKARVGDQLAGYIKSISGATVTDRERTALLENIPKMDDNDESFTFKLQKLQSDLQRIRNRTVSNIGRQGKDVSEFQTSAPATELPVVTDPNEL